MRTVFKLVIFSKAPVTRVPLWLVTEEASPSLARDDDVVILPESTSKRVTRTTWDPFGLTKTVHLEPIREFDGEEDPDFLEALESAGWSSDPPEAAE